MPDNKQLLKELKKKMLSDLSLPLRDGAANLVFADGSAEAEVLFIGEGPGYWEDQKGIPFVGNAGALLNQMLYSIKLPREEIFITNVIHFRPPNNRDPLPEELSAFEPYLDRMIEIIKPKLVVTLGRFSMAKFIKGAMISSVHGKPRVVDWKGKRISVIPMYHPAAGLRNGEIKRRLNEDFKKIPEVLEKIDEPEVETVKKEAKQMSLV
jgi:DNA polymerase